MGTVLSQSPTNNQKNLNRLSTPNLPLSIGTTNQKMLPFQTLSPNKKTVKFKKSKIPNHANRNSSMSFYEQEISKMKSNHFSFPDGFLVRMKSNSKVNNQQITDLSTSIASSSSSSTSGVISSASSTHNNTTAAIRNNNTLLTSSSSTCITPALDNNINNLNKSSSNKKNSRITSITKKFKQNFLPDSKNKKNHSSSFVNNSSSSSSCTPPSLLSSSTSSTRSSFKTTSNKLPHQKCKHDISNVNSCIHCYESLKTQQQQPQPQQKEQKSSNNNTFLNRLNIIRRQRLKTKSPSVVTISTLSTATMTKTNENKVIMRPKSERNTNNTKSMFIENFNSGDNKSNNRLSTSNSFKIKFNNATNSLIKNSLSVFNLKSSSLSVQSSISSGSSASSSSSTNSSSSSFKKKKNESLEEIETNVIYEKTKQEEQIDEEEHENDNNITNEDTNQDNNNNNDMAQIKNEATDVNISTKSTEINSLKTNSTININNRMFINNNEDLLNRQQHLVQKIQKQDEYQDNLQQQQQQNENKKMNNVALLQKNFSYLNVNTLCKCRTCITKQELQQNQQKLEKRLITQQIQQQNLELKNEQQVNHYVTTSSLTSKQCSKVVIQASTNELLRSLINFLIKRCTYIKDLNANESLQWIKNADRQLILQGWQEIAFLNPANIVFFYLLIRDTLNFNQNIIQTASEFKCYLLSCLYLAFSYMGNEISYPLKPFVVEENRNIFWQRIIKLIGQLSKQMLRLNQDPKYFTEIFTELKSFSNFNEINNSKDMNLFKKFQQNISQQFQQKQQRENNLMSTSLSILNTSSSFKQNRFIQDHYQQQQQQQQLQQQQKLRRMSYISRQQAESLANQQQYFQKQLKLQQQLKQQSIQTRNIMTKSCNGADIFVNRFPV